MTSAASPTLSPCLSIHIHRCYTAPATPQSTSRNRWFTTPVPATSPLLSSSAGFVSPARLTRVSSINQQDGKRPLQEQYTKRRRVSPSTRYVDVGTQYSPEGAPPTAPLSKPPKEPTAEREPHATSVIGQRRKESGSLESEGTVSHNAIKTSNTAPPPPPELEPEPKMSPSTSRSHALTDGVVTHHAESMKRSRPEPDRPKIMPSQYKDCNARDLGGMISVMLMELTRLNDLLPLEYGKLTRFHSRAPPGIGVSQYLQRLIQHATLPPAILLSMVWYIDQLCQMYPIFTINSLTVHRFLITAATVAAKGLSDIFWTNPIYAKIGGIPVTELATLELELLKKLEWKTMPKAKDLEEYYRGLVERTEGYEFDTGAGESGNTNMHKEACHLPDSDVGTGDGEDVDMLDDSD